ncbi:MAG: hemerythrin domain-containing protein [Propionibacteriaceae bacterium]|nr:hemerythrin domain-containing protein [Propionibacteriaceae bacterium]
MSEHTHRTTPTQTKPEAGADVWHMGLIHRTMSARFDLLSTLIAETGGTDPVRRDALVADLDLALRGLHHHHRGEDTHLWPKLHARVPEESTTITRMAAAHQDIDALLDQVQDCAQQWSTAAVGPAAAAASTTLVEAMTRFRIALADHLAEEERLIVPLLAQHITRAEWDEFGKLMSTNMPRSGLPIFMGMVHDAATEDEAREFFAPMPGFVKAIWKLSGRKQYAKYMARLHGTH